ncbi:MAG: TlpA family protein disulfide reductase [Thiotrichales bacterium]|nr:TlpA family protein disulfide reductase [Thiotrichales bacterium]
MRWFGFVLLLSFWPPAHAWQTQTRVLDGVEVPFYQALATEPVAQVLWVPSEYGVLAEEKRLAEQLVSHKMSVTMFDPFEAQFLAPSSEALLQIPPSWLRQALEQLQTNPQPIWIIAPNQAGILALRALEQLQWQAPTQNIGLILLNPNLYLSTPEPGQMPSYWPQVANSNLPISVLQAELSPWRWHLADLQQQLGKNGSRVFLKLLPQVRDRFYFRADAQAYEREKREDLAQQLLAAMRWQLDDFSLARTVAHLSEAVPISPKKGGFLQPYQGPQSLPLKRPLLEGGEIDLTQLKGRVVLVNFWASWCPPCVHEMPSMAALKQHYQDQPFEIVAVNLGEDWATVMQFQKQHRLNFLMALDPTGQVVKDWRVFAYPSSYLLDKTGRIHSALFGATDWQDAAHRQIIDSLLAPAP